ncbi:unnamed protein product [Phytomonas sp. EM1]|nr:unnamed protein product [Phytomonas sp. EM1]|eukprot:CCW60962.1 unnamed protein product [Phytomonas sp. isolate EM1]
MSSVAVLSKKLRELEKQAKFLRNEVASLEATKRDVIFSESTRNRSEEFQRQSQGDQQHDVSSHSPDQAKSVDRLSRGNKLAFHFPDLIDQMSQRIGDTQSSIKRHRELQLEKERLTSMLMNFENDIQHMDEEYTELMELNRSNMDEESRPLQLVQAQDELNSELQELVEMYRERELLQGQLNNQSAELWQLSTLIQDTVNAQEQKQEALNVLADKTTKLSELRKKRIQLEHAVKTKNSLIEKKTTHRPEEEVLKGVNNDFQVALRALEREDDQLKSNDAIIRHRAMQIAKTQKRLELIGEAVAGDESDGEERVDVEVADRLVVDIDALYDLHAEACAHMDKLDSEIEKMEYKVGAINRAILGAKKELNFVNDNSLRKIQLLRKEAAREQKLNKLNISLLEGELAQLQKTGANKQRSSKSHRRTKIH